MKGLFALLHVETRRAFGFRMSHLDVMSAVMIFI